MNQHRLILSLAACAVLVTGCGSPAAAVLPAPPPGPTARPAGAVSATGNVVPAQRSHLSFVLTATVKEVEVQEGQPVKAGQVLMVLDTPDLRWAVTAAQAAVRSAQADVDRLNYPYTKVFRGRTAVYVKEFAERRQVAQSQLQAAQAALQAAQAALAEGMLLAPYDGTVVALDAAAGQLVQPGQVVAEIGRLDHLQIETQDLSERQIHGLQIGQAATIRIQALNQSFSGKVSAIAPIATQYKGDWVYQVTLQLDQQPTGLLWGMSADVEIHTQ